jgi:hypothetical protein
LTKNCRSARVWNVPKPTIVVNPNIEIVMNFSPEQDQYLQLAQSRAYYEGLRDGIHKYAHWRDGVQYVGTTGRTLQQALDEVNQAESDLLDRYNQLNML